MSNQDTHHLIERIIAQAPPLTDEQRAHLTELVWGEPNE